MKSNNTKTMFFDEARYASELKTYNETAESFQALMTEFQALKLPFKITSVAELQELAADPGKYIKNRIAEGMGEQKISGLNVSKAKTVEMLEMPDFSELEQCAKECRKYHNVNYLTNTGTTITVNVEAVAQLRDQCSILASTPDEVAAIEAHRLASECLEQIAKVVPLIGELPLKKLFVFTDGRIIMKNYFWAEQHVELLKHRNE